MGELKFTVAQVIIVNVFLKQCDISIQQRLASKFTLTSNPYHLDIYI